MLNRIHEISNDAGERLEEIILELEADREIPLPRDIRIALYDAGTALSRLSTAIMKNGCKAPVDIGKAMTAATKRALRSSGREF